MSKKHYFSINNLRNQTVTFVSEISDQYKVVDNPPSSISTATFLEYIPKNDSSNNWTSIITLQSMPKMGLKASEFVKKIKYNMIKSASSHQILQSDDLNTGSYMFSSITLVYVFNRRREVICAQYYSGPMDCCGIQYTRRIGEDAKVEDVLKEMNSFIDKIVRIEIK